MTHPLDPLDPRDPRDPAHPAGPTGPIGPIGSIGAIEKGPVETRGNAYVRHYRLSFPQPVDKVWATVATSEGLRAWLAVAEPFEPRLGGAVGLQGEGRITAWDVERVAEYTVQGRGRVRFHLEPAHPTGTTVRFTHESDEATDPGWHARFERLVRAVADQGR